jgi:hypothetical protein
MGNIRGIEVLKRGSRIGAAGNEKIMEAGKKNGGYLQFGRRHP